MRMYVLRLIVGCLLLFCTVIPCQAGTFKKAGSSFSMTRDVHLDCSTADLGDRDWYLSQTVEDDPDGYTSWGHTPILKKGTEFLVSMDSAETARTDMYYDNPNGEGEALSVTLEGVDPVYNRVNCTSTQRTILEVWQPGYGATYSVRMDLSTSAVAYFKIEALSGEKTGDEVTLSVNPWTEHSENNTGPASGAIIQYINPGVGVTGYNCIAGTPGYVNLSDGVWHNLTGSRYFTARIGDTIGLRTSVFSMLDYTGEIVSWVRDHYMPRSLRPYSSLSVSIVPKPLAGDLDGNQSVSIGDGILALQVASGLNPYTIRYDYAIAGVDIDGDNRVGLAEAIYILQAVAGFRKN